MLPPFRCSDYFVQVLFMSRTTLFYKAKREGPHHIHSLPSSCFIKTSAFNIAGNLVMVVKFTFQSVFGNSRRNPRHSSARGREESLELYSILWSDRPTSKQKVLRHGMFFGGREATIGNASAVRRLNYTVTLLLYAWLFVCFCLCHFFMNTSVISSSPIERKKPFTLKYESHKGSSEFRVPTSDFQLLASSFRLPTSDLRLP